MSMEKLLMHVALVDQITKPLQGITKEVQSSMEAGKQGMQNMATGGAGLVAAGFAIQNALMPAIEMDRKLGEVKSLDVTDDALTQLQATALDFAAEYGKSAADFVAASYDIQSAIAGLNGDELSQFTKASGVLAAATKADTTTITSYMGTMYGIFEQSATEMGKGEWVEQISGMTATAVQMFKTDGSKMAQAFSALGSSATAMGADVAEQMAVLGTLQATMGGSEAATKYTAFLGGAVKAQDKLGLSFTDSEGRLLPMVDILSKLDGAIGHMGEASQYAVLKDAFGSEEAVKLIQNLLPKTEQLSNNIDQLGHVQGMSKAEEMASAMTDQWERLEASWFAVRAAVFGAILPSINAIVGSMADGMVYITGWTDEFPWLAEILGYVAIAGLSLGGVVAILSLAMGVAQMMSAGWAITMNSLLGLTKLLSLSMQMLSIKTWLLNAAFWANPITWLVAGIAAAAAAIWVFKDYIAAFLSGFIDGFVEASGVVELFQPLLSLFGLIGDAVAWTFNWLIQLLTPIDAASESLSGFAAAGELVGLVVGSIFRGLLMPIELVMTAIDQFINLLNKIPGVDIELDSSVDQAVKVAQETAEHSEALPLSKGSVSSWNQPSNQPKLNQQIVSNLHSSNTKGGDKVNQFNGDINVHTQQMPTPDQLAEFDELNVGA
ncbi:phage tail tape measure protein [Vibrio pectenicida]|uniref:Phage tail tape measure protein n=1 Tax=Vibrio pectenicida TaxID=62763 RepID=A0A3R9F631_9VIBR|nr:phage tail tape measure protein [Vibrio pectenicida]RSD30715.1 phage tail tape measure protein [Vibrio pectenicida]